MPMCHDGDAFVAGRAAAGCFAARLDGRASSVGRRQFFGRQHSLRRVA
jgi:hypothetical protein